MGMRLDPSAKIGPGLYIGHYGGIRINMDTQIGENCSLTHNVTIGTKGLGKKGIATYREQRLHRNRSRPLFGHISVGDGARIAANTLVTRSVPAGATGWASLAESSSAHLPQLPQLRHRPKSLPPSACQNSHGRQRSEGQITRMASALLATSLDDRRPLVLLAAPYFLPRCYGGVVQVYSQLATRASHFRFVLVSDRRECESKRSMTTINNVSN